MERVLAIDAAQPLHDVAATRAIEQRALGGLPPHTLMQRAGMATARLALALAPHARRVWVAAGPGNNGGDGLDAALHLHRLGRQVQVTLLGDPQRAPDDARDALARAQAGGVPIDAEWPDDVGAIELAIDALLGIGGTRAPQGALADAIARVNACNAPRLAIDVPSGLDADHGIPLGEPCIEATHTLTLLARKPGLFTAAGRDYAGEVWFDSLDVADDGTAPSAWLSGRPQRQVRRHRAHKGSFGDLIVVGGARGMSGAALLAARAALAAGAGRVYVCPLDPDAPLLDPARPELMLRALHWAREPHALAAATVVWGCGGGSAVRDVLDDVIARARSLLLDADALNAIAADDALRRRVRVRAAHARATVLTPHPLEAARLLGSDARAVQADRLGAAQRLADELQVVVLLKGSGSVIAAPGRVPHINPTGNAALASAGTGDVLAGWIGGAWAASGLHDRDGAWHASIDSAWRHGAAADVAGASRALRASELIDAIAALD